LRCNKGMLWRGALPLGASAVNGAATMLFYVLLVDRYGVGTGSDLVFAISLLPNVLYTVTFGQLNEILVPLFVRGSRAMMPTVFWNVAIAAGVTGAGFGVLMFFPLSALAPIFYPDVTSHFSSDVIRQLLILGLIFNALYSVLMVKNCYLVAQGRTVQMQCVMAAGNALAAFWIWSFSSAGNLLQVPAAQIAGAALPLLFPVLARHSTAYLSGHIREHLREVSMRVRWLVANACISRLDPLIEGVIASFIGPGMLTTFYLFQRVIGSSHAIVHNGFILPFSKRASELATAAPAKFNHHRLRSARDGSLLVLALIAASAGLLVLLHYAPLAALRSYADVFRQHALVFVLLLGYGIFTITAKIYAVSLVVLRRERWLAAATVASVMLSLTMKYFGARWLGLSGLAAACSLSCLCYAIVLGCGLASMQQKAYSAEVRIARPWGVFAE